MSEVNSILYIAFRYENGNESNGSAFNYLAWYQSLGKLCHIDGLFYEDYVGDALKEKVLTYCEINKPDMVFFIPQKNQIPVELLIELKKNNFFTVGFFGDDQWRFDSFTKHYARHFEICITTDKYSISKYQENHQKRVIQSQWASLQPQNSGTHIDDNFKYDVSFVGGYNRYRDWFISYLRRSGINIACFGGGWGDRRVTYLEMEDIFRTSKINLNLSNGTSFDLRYLLKFPRSLISLYRSFKGIGKDANQLKARNFEIPCFGGFQLTNYVPGLEDYFEIGKEVACYSSPEDAITQIKFYLKNENVRSQVCLAGVQRARANHTFDNRVADFFRLLEDAKCSHSNKSGRMAT